MTPLLVALLGFFNVLPAVVLGYNWNYPVAPLQCSNFTVVVTGSVVFPLKILIVPVGPSPLPHEVRSVMEIPFPPNATTLNFQMNYPASSKFVGLVADASGYYGNASAWEVLSSDDASCFDATKDAVPPFRFKISPTDIAECRDVRIYWALSDVQGNPFFLYVIPNGEFGSIPLGNVDTQTFLGTGFTWRPPIRASKNLIIVGGDNRGTGSGGYISSIVNPGDPNRDENGDCPAQTPPPPGPTLNVGAIVGGVVGGVAFLGLLILGLCCLVRKKRRQKVVNPNSVEQYAAASSPKPPRYNEAAYSGPILAPIPTQAPGWTSVPQETTTGGQLPMQVVYSDNTGTTAVSSSGGWQGSSPWKATPATQTTPQWSSVYTGSPPWDGRI